MREDNRNRILINRVNKSRTKKGMSDTVKVIIITILVMTIITVILVWVGNLDLAGNQPDQSVHGAGSEASSFTGPDPGSPGSSIFENVDLIDHVFYWDNGGNLELPVIGATGWAAANLALRGEPSTTGRYIVTISPGRGFRILDAIEGWWYVQLDTGATGWADHRRCFINLPDVIPSIVYNNTNASASIFRSSGAVLPGITGFSLYNARAYNPRLGREEYIVPAMYLTAQALFLAQQEALQNGETLVVYEVFRPRATQNAVVNSMQSLMRDNRSVYYAIADSPWNLTDFISLGRSNHQRGAAVDAALALASEVEFVQVGDYSFVNITQHTMLRAGSAMHELSPESVIINTRGEVFTPAAILAGTVRWSDTVTPAVVNLQRYFAAAGFEALRSEWWHFNHMQSINIANQMGITGEFFIETVYSVPPVR